MHLFHKYSHIECLAILLEFYLELMMRYVWIAFGNWHFGMNEQNPY